MLVLVVLLVAALSTVVASAFGGNAPHPIVTVPLALAVIAALSRARAGSGGTRARSAR